MKKTKLRIGLNQKRKPTSIRSDVGQHAKYREKSASVYHFCFGVVTNLCIAQSQQFNTQGNEFVLIVLHKVILVLCVSESYLQ